jgi:CheY-like chemotaxis protein
MSGPNFESEGSKARRFFRFLWPQRNPEKGPIRLDGLAFAPVAVGSKKILIVDDDAVTLKALSIKLGNVGYQVVSAMDGADAIRVMREERPDLTILDIHFPPDVAHGGGVPWNGFLLMTWLAAMEEGQKVPTIFISGNAGPGIREKALTCGALGLFDKPIDYGRLLNLVQKAFTGGAADPSFRI